MLVVQFLVVQFLEDELYFATGRTVSTTDYFRVRMTLQVSDDEQNKGYHLTSSQVASLDTLAMNAKLCLSD